MTTPKKTGTAGTTVLVCVLALGAGAATALVPAGCRQLADHGSPMPLFAHPGSCRQCHTDLVQNVPVAAPERMPCIESGCHASIRESPAFVHAPVEVSACTTCHLPHAARRRNLIADLGGECSSCHERLLHCPARDGRTEPCTSCHKAHGGESRYFLLSEAASER